MRLLLIIHSSNVYGFIISFLLLFLLCTLIYVTYKSKNSTKPISHLSNQTRLKARIIENLVHDIKTPLQLIHDVLKTIDCRDTQSEEILNVGLRHTKALNEEVESLLHSLEKDNVFYTVVNEEVELLAFFNDFLTIYSFNLTDKSLTLELTHNLTDKTKTVLDKKKISRILTNYLDNAVYYAPEHSTIKLTVSTKLNTLSFHITNEGINIDPEDIHLAFNRFYQSDIEGIHDGINLAIVKELSDTLNGTVFIKCTQNQTVQSFSLRTQVEQIGFSTKPTVYPKENQQNKISPSDKLYHILVVDDSTLMLDFYRRILSEHYNCDFAKDGLEALEKIKDNNYQCIITDIIMPNCDGYELSKRIRSVDFYKQVPIIFVSGIATHDHKENLERVGVQDIILKPISIQELHTRIHNLIHNYNLRLSHIDSVYSNSESIENPYMYQREEDEELLKRILKSIHKNISNSDFKVSDLATSIFYSERQLARKTNLLTGLSPSKLILEIRLCKAYNLLSEFRQMRIIDVQEQVGIKSAAYFHKQFKRRFGITPGSVQPHTH